MARPIGASKERRVTTPEQAFGSVITDLRIKRGMSQEQLAHKLGYHLSYIGMLEQGKKSPTLRTIFNFASLFEVSVRTLMGSAERLLGERTAKRRQ